MSVNAPSLRRDVKATYQQHAAPADWLQARNRDPQPRSRRENETGALEPHYIELAISRRARKLGQPLTFFIVHECLGPGATSPAASFEKLPKRVTGFQRPRLECHRRCEQGGQTRHSKSRNRCGHGGSRTEQQGTRASPLHSHEQLGWRRCQSIELEGLREQAPPPIVRQRVIEYPERRIKLLGRKASPGRQQRKGYGIEGKRGRIRASRRPPSRGPLPLRPSGLPRTIEQAFPRGKNLMQRL